MEKLLQAHNIAQPSQNRGTVNVDGQPYRVDAYVNGNYIGSLSETFPRSISLDWAAGEYERIGGTDVGGTIAYLTNLRAAYPSVRLEVVSDAFQQVAGLAGPFNTIITTGDLPISVTFNGIDTVTYEREAIGSPGYKYAEYKLLAQDCEPGSGPCCDEQGFFRNSSTVCRKSTGDCDLDRTCNGKDATCPVNPVADGTECAYYPLDEIIDRFKPFNPKGWPAHTNSKKHGSSPDGHSHGHSPCTGKCDAGKCNLDKSHPGCCTLGPWKYLEAEAQQAPGTGKTAAAEYKTKEGEVYCWEGTDSSNKDYGKVKP